jgi:hypothetical protein
MHFYLRVQRWVAWWFDVGVIFGAIALVNVFSRNLTRPQERAIFLSGVAFWTLGGLVCYAFQGIRIHAPEAHLRKTGSVALSVEGEWHQASDFLLPGERKSILPFKH